MRGTQSFRPVATLGWVVIALLGLTGLVDVIAVVAGVEQLDLLERFASGAFVSDAEIDASDRFYGRVGLVQSGLVIAAAVAFIMWFHRSYRNVPAMGGRCQYGSGWAIGSWFVPVLSLFRPCQMASDIRKTVDTPAKAMLLGWWLVWVVNGVLGGHATMRMFETIGNDALDGEELLSTLRLDTQWMLAADAVDVVAAALAVVVVLALTRGQTEAAARAEAPA